MVIELEKATLEKLSGALELMRAARDAYYQRDNARANRAMVVAERSLSAGIHDLAAAWDDSLTKEVV